ncbi:hypothetical protein BZL30_1244 [Mycobacterium kansasii]|uniref:Uncharacterized protein n=1 Tax=Mycobacterium kansasii TaxID=1768 RepID=A0A1V3XUE5_MYCKA|nr:hypothetical protein BZL30_1244 [Mycobacterium kansasii]
MGRGPNSSASPAHAVAACNMGAEPAPMNIRKELISGGSTQKLTAPVLQNRLPGSDPICTQRNDK